MRLFIAAELPEDALDAALENLAELRELLEGRCVRQDSLHVTLAFIGEVDTSHADVAAECMKAACREHRAFTIDLDDYGSFGRKDKAVLWQGIANCPELVDLAKDVRHELTQAGFDIDPKPFTPHITLMRNANITQGVLPMPFVGSGDITRITLFQTIWTDNGGVYEALETVELPGDNQRATQGRTLFIDADACPVTSAALSCARKAKIPVVIAGNSTQNLLKHVRKNDPLEPTDGFWVSQLQAPIGADSADFAIVEQLEPGDVLVTQDIGLAAMALGRSAAAIGVRGRIYTRDTIDSQLLIRHEEKKVRRQGGRTQGPAAFTEEDRARFIRNLERLLNNPT